MNRLNFMLFVLLLTSLVGLSDCRADQDETDYGEYLINGVISARESWVCGVVSIDGSFTLRDGSEKNEVRIEGAFDFSSLSHRFVISKGIHGNGVCISTPEMRVECLDDNGSCVNIMPPDSKPSPFVIAPDIRLIGLVPISDFLKAGRGGLGDFRKVLASMSCETARRLKDGKSIVGFTQNVPGGIFRYEFVIDVASNFAVERATVRVDLDSGESKTVYENKLQSSIVNESAVPSAWAGTMDDSSCTVSLDWKKFNEPLDSILFTVDSIPVRQGSLIVDHRVSGKPTIIGRLGTPDYVPPSERLQDGGMPPSRSSRPLIYVSLLAILVLSIWYWRKSK